MTTQIAAFSREVGSQLQIRALWMLIGLIPLGCASPGGVNPTHPTPNVGYVDFYSQDKNGPAWVVHEPENAKQLVGEHKLKNAILRIERPSGEYAFRLAILRGDSASTLPSETKLIRVKVEVGQVTPVTVSCPVSGTVKLPSSSQAIHAPFLVMPKIVEIERYGDMWDIVPVVGTPLAFKEKKEMPYYRKIPLLF